jgi:hypothetical protein
MVRDKFVHAMFGALSLVVLLPVPALAQGATGSIAGVVRDSTGGVLPGVTVEASSPALIEKLRSVVTDDQGLYKIIDLRPGLYTVTFLLQGFNTIRREGIELSVNFTAQVNAEMPVGALEETVTVSGQSPMVDVQNVVQQRVVTRDVMDAIPSNKTFANMAALIPGMTVSGRQDVGGSAGDTSVSLSIHGSRGSESQIEIDGMPIHNGLARGGGMFGFYLNNGMAEELSIQTSGVSAEYEVAGVRNNVIPKEGGNIFRGSFFTKYSSEALQSDNLSDDLIARGLTSVNPVDKIWDFNPAFGGPVIQDRAWFFSAFRHWGTYNKIAGLYYDKDPLDFVYTPDLSRQVVHDIYHVSQDLRLTTQVTQKNKINVFYEFQYSRYGKAYNPSATTAPEAYGYYRHRPQYLIQASWSSPVTSRVLLEAGGTLSANDYHGYRQPGLSDTVSSVLEMRTNMTFRAAPSSYGFNRSNNYNYRGSASYVTGSHAFKAGFFLMHTWGYQTTEVNNATNLRLLDGVPVEVQVWATPIEYREKVKYNLGLYVQDQWTIRRTTFNLGVRSDFYNAYVEPQNLPAGPYVPAREFPGVYDTPNWRDLHPRFGVSHDIFGNGKTAVKASLGRYNVGTPLNQFTRLANPVQSTVHNATRGWTDVNGDFIPQENELRELSNKNFGQASAVTVRYADDVREGANRRLMNWEFSASAQHELFPRVSVTGGYYRRWFDNFTVTDNLDVVSADHEEYCVTAPADSRLPGGGGDRICGLYDIVPQKFGLVNNLITLAENFGTQREIYDGFDLGVNTRLVNGLLLAGGINSGRTKTDACFVVDSPQALRFCEVKPPMLAQLKFYGVYPLPWWGLQTSATYQSLPGPQITATHVVTSAQIRPSLGRELAGGVRSVTIDLVEPGTIFGERMHQVDFRLTKTFNLGRARMQAMLDVYNLFNANPVLALNTRFGPAWQTPTQILSARLFQFGAQMSF